MPMINMKKKTKTSKKSTIKVEFNWEYRKTEKDIFDFDPKSLAKKVIKEVIGFETIKDLLSKGFTLDEKFEVNILCVGNPKIKKINTETRKIKKETDCLSFPMWQWSIETGNFVLGDIVISIDKVISQAKEYGHSVKREFAFLICHSILHLLGYDHMKKKDANIMEKRQDEILNSLKIKR